MKFHAIQFDAILHNWEANRQEVEQQISALDPNNNDFIVLQEMTDTGWSMKLDRITDIGTVDWACKLSKKYHCWLQVGWADRDGDRGKNCITICSPRGEPLGTYTKIFTCNPMNENNHYEAGNELIIVDLGELSVCPFICYDLRFPELLRPAAIEGVDVFTVSSSWPQVRIAHWRSLLIARAVENQSFVVASNRVGKDAIALWGGTSMIISYQGEVLGEASQMSNETISETINPELARQWRSDFPVLKDVRTELIGSIKVTRITT